MGIFRSIWSREKQRIETLGLIIGIGALFLNINLPQDQPARDALINIQFLWFLIIAILIIYFLFRLFIVAWALEQIEKTEDKYILSIISSWLILVLAIFAYNFWIYFKGLYGDILFKMSSVLGLTIVFSITSLCFYFLKRNKNSISFLISLFAESMLWAIDISVFIAIYTNELQGWPKLFLITYVCVILSLFIIGIPLGYLMVKIKKLEPPSHKI